MLLGAVCGALNFGATMLAQLLGIPLFSDTIFTVTASCFGSLSGIVAGFVYHLVVVIYAYGTNFYAHPADMAFFVCSLTIVLSVRILLGKKWRVTVLSLLVLAMVLALVISAEGGLLYTLLFSFDAYHKGIDNQAVSTLIYVFLTQQVPILASATLARIPVNLVDKLIAVFAGWYLAVALNAKRQNKQKRSKKE